MKKKLYEILYEDKDILIVNNSAGLLVGADRWTAKLPALIRYLKNFTRIRARGKFILSTGSIRKLQAS